MIIKIILIKQTYLLIYVKTKIEEYMTTAEVVALIEAGSGKQLYTIFSDLITEHQKDFAIPQKEMWEM